MVTTRNCETRVFSTRHTNFNAPRHVIDRAQFAIPIIFVAAHIIVHEFRNIFQLHRATVPS